MNSIEDQILQVTQAAAIQSQHSVQTLWSGYGEIVRYRVVGGRYPSVIVKHIQWPESNKHPRGWNTAISHQRKLTSYQVERHFYQHFSTKTTDSCRVPHIYHVGEDEGEIFLLMEDLNASGFAHRKVPGRMTVADAKNCLTWLAHFHATFMQAVPSGLWPIGTYWHLDTRPDEWSQMQNKPLKQAAKAIDERLNDAKFQTLVHGDAKLANFCFGENGEVAAVDFQYVGRGCGMKDVAYFMSSCFSEDTCQQYEVPLLDHYFAQLESVLDHSVNFQELKREWKELYRYAWADFYRFLDGWSPGHWKMHGYSESITQQIIKELMS